MLAQKPPIRVIAPGRTYRRDSDATHSPMFHQVEGLVIDEETHLGPFEMGARRILQILLRSAAAQDAPAPFLLPLHRTIRGGRHPMRPLRRANPFRRGQGLDGDRRLGMVHPRVLELCGIDPKRYQGYAFGFGIDRLAMLKYGIPDLRPFFESDLRWLKHYGFAALDIPTLHEGLSR